MADRICPCGAPVATRKGIPRCESCKVRRRGVRICPCGTPVATRTSSPRCDACKAKRLKASSQRSNASRRNPCQQCGVVARLGRGRRHCENCRREGVLRRDAAGYVWRQGLDGAMLQHRFVMEQVLGRRLEPHENVHHVNGIRDDNRPENLELWVVWQPQGQRAADLAEWVVEQYPELVEAALAKRRQLRLVV